jgi:hypothetical protein
MKRLACTILATSALLLGGCATTSTIRSNVTTFQQWPAQLNDKTYAFEAVPAADDTLEYRSYLDLLRTELRQIGLNEAPAGAPAALKVSMHFGTADLPVRVIEFYDPFSTRYGFYAPYRRGFWGFHGAYPPGPMTDEVVETYHRELKVAIISNADGKHLFDVKVHNVSGELSTPAMMPALMHSAFIGFPGQNGAAHRVELRQEKG